MLFIYAHICIKTNDFVAKYFIISRSCREGFSIAPFLYTARRTCGLYYKEGEGGSDIQGVKLHEGKDWYYIETKLCMFADDNQLFDKNDESIKISFVSLLALLSSHPSVVNNYE